jgi:transposase
LRGYGPGIRQALARKFEPTAQSIRNWVAQADRDTGRRDDGVTYGKNARDSRVFAVKSKRLRKEREGLGFSRGLRYRA